MLLMLDALVDDGDHVLIGDPSVVLDGDLILSLLRKHA
jgi:hypothetical protein